MGFKLAKYGKFSEQSRKTHEDTLNAQVELLKFIKNKIQHPLLSEYEFEKLVVLSANALLSCGATYKFTFPWKSKDSTRSAILNLGSLHTVLLKMETYASNQETVISIYGEKYRVRAVDLWKKIYEDLKVVFPNSLGEAHKRSKEYVRKDGLYPHDFYLDEKVEDE